MNSDDDDLPVLTQVLRTGGRLPAPTGDHPGDWMPARASVDRRDDTHDDPGSEPEWPRALVIGSDADADAHEDVDSEVREWPVTQESAVFRNGHATANPSGAGAFFDAMPTAADPRRIDLRDNDVFLRTSPTGTAFSGLFDEPPLVVRQADAVDEGAGAVAPAAAEASTDSTASSAMVSRDVPLTFRQAPSSAPVLDATFALRVRDSVLQQLSGRIDTELDARIAQTLHAELETALAHLQNTLRIELAEALRDVVGHAVDDAIRRLDASSPIDDEP